MAEKNMRLRVILDLADKALAPLKRISQGSSETAQTLKAARDQLKQLDATQKAVGAFRETRAGLGETEAKLQAARERVKQLALQFNQAGVPTKAMTTAMAAARTEANQLGAKFNSQQQHLQQLRDKLQTAGISTKNLAEHDKQLRASMATTRLDIAKQTQALKAQADMQQRVAGIKQAQADNVAARGNARGALFDGVALAATLAAPIKMAVDFESSMADVAKVMDFSDDNNGLAKLSKSAIDLSKTLPMAAADIAQIMALGGQSGLNPAELLGMDGKVGFTEHAIKMGTAFGMSAEEAGTSMAKMKSAFGMSIPEVATLTDKINLLGNTGAANEKQILSILTRVGPLGGVAGVASGEIAALGSTLAGMGVAEEVAATGIQNLMLSLVAGEAATKSQREALKKLGLDSVKIAKGMQKDATGTMLGVFEKLQGLKDYEQASVMTQLFGKESIKAIAPMLTQLDTLKENFAKVNDETRYADAVNKEYAARAATTANQLQLAKNQAAAFGITLGNALLPALNDTLKAFMPWVNRLTEIAQANPEVTKGIVMAVGALMLLKIAAIAGAYAFTFVRGAALSVQAALMAGRMGWMIYTGAMVASTTTSKAAMVVSKGLAAAQWLINAAMSANPIGLLIIAIGLLIAAGVLLWKNWDEVVAGAKLVWQGLSNFLGNLWTSIATTAGTAWAGMVQNFTQFGSWIIDGIIGGITNRLSALKETIVGAASSAANWFKEKLGIASPSKVFTQFGGWISEGAANGIEAGQAGVRAASVAMAAAALTPATAATGGAGSTGPTPSVAAAPVIMAKAPAPAAAPAAGNTYTITIQAAAGADPSAIARAVAAELDKRERAVSARSRSALYDTH